MLTLKKLETDHSKKRNVLMNDLQYYYGQYTGCFIAYMCKSTAFTVTIFYFSNNFCVAISSKNGSVLFRTLKRKLGQRVLTLC